MGTGPLTIDTCPPLMTVVELATVLRVGKNTAYSLISKRIIPSVKIGRQLRIYREDVVACASDIPPKHRMHVRPHRQTGKQVENSLPIGYNAVGRYSFTHLEEGSSSVKGVLYERNQSISAKRQMGG